jgi:RNAse (barnase) inhibitor barstar
MSRSSLADILGHPERNGVYRLAGAMAVAGAVHIPGRQLTDKPAMLDALADELAFPDYFGGNWDALEECLTDLSWRQGPVVLQIDAAATPEDKAPEAWGTLLEILAEAARFWAEEGRPFAVFLQGGHAAYPVVAP